MKKVTAFIDGFNLYHAIDALQKNHLKWSNPFLLVKNFLQLQEEEILRTVFFTAHPHHTPTDVQDRYACYKAALEHYGIEVVEGKFKKKIMISKDKNGQKYTRTSHEEKETDVNLALAILEDAYERTSDKLLVITNDSDIAPAIRLAKKKNTALKINVITPPLIKTKRANHELLDASGDVNKNRRGQVFFKTRMIQEIHLERARMPELITKPDGTIIEMPFKYRMPR